MTTRRTSQILLALTALFGVLAFVCAMCSCQVSRGERVDGMSMESWLEELGVKLSHPGSQSRATTERSAIPSVRNKDAKGRYVLPVCPLCGAHPIDIWTGYHCGNGHSFETPNQSLP